MDTNSYFPLAWVLTNLIGSSFILETAAIASCPACIPPIRT